MKWYIKQRHLAIFLVIAMLFSMIPFGAFSAVGAKGADQIVTFAIGQANYQKGGMNYNADVAPYIKDNRTMVPVAFVAPALGTDKATWIPESQMVRITRGNDLIMIKIGSRELTVNGKVIVMDTAAEIKDIGDGGGRTMLPISFIAKALGVGYQWNNYSRSVDFYGYSETFDQAGTFGPATGSETIAGNVTVATGDVRLQNKVIKGDLIIAESVGDGDVFLDNITVEGNTYVRGGGKNSIHINGGSYTNVVIENTPDGGTRVVATNTEGINIVVATAQAGEQVILEGTFATVEVTATNANVSTQGQTTIQNMTVNNTATVNVAAGTTVNTVTLNAVVTVSGEGNVTNANVNISGTTLTSFVDTIILGEGVEPPIQRIEPETPAITPTTGGGGGGGSDDDGGSDTPVQGTLDVTPLYFYPPGVETVSNTISLSGTTFTTASENISNWTINTGTTNLTVDSITKTGDASVTIDYTVPTNYSTGTGLVTYIAKAAAVTNGVDTAQGSITLVDYTEIAVGAGEFNITVSETHLNPASNPITSGTMQIDTSLSVGTFLDNISIPAGAQFKVANANDISGAFEDWVFADITGKASSEMLVADDLLLVLSVDGYLRGYYITVSGGGSGTPDTTPPTVTFSPEDGATNIATGSTVTITFNEAVRKIDDSELVDGDLSAMLTFKETDAAGSDVAFTGAINAEKKVITMTPNISLANNQYYYVAIAAEVEDASDNAITAANAIFRTGNIQPVATGDSVTVAQGSTVLIDVLANDSDADGNTLQIVSFTQGGNGVVTQEGDSLRYTPNADFRETDSFEYQITDGNGGVDTATVNITVTIANSLSQLYTTNYVDQNGYIDFPFTIVAENMYVFETEYLNQSCDTIMYLNSSGGNPIATNDNYIDSYATIIIKLGSGDYVLRIGEKNSEQFDTTFTISQIN